MDSVGRATKPACEPRLMMRPRFCRIITRPAAWLAKNVPFRLTARVRSKSFSRTFSAGFSGATPALFTRMSNRPKCATAAATADWISSRRLMSICRRRARRPIASISVARSPAVFASRRPRATSAPAWARASAQARPIPRAEPVTRATWPFTSKRGKSSLFMDGVLSNPCAFYAQPKDRERRSATWSSGLIRQGGPPWVEDDRTGAVVEVDALEEAGRQQTVLGAIGRPVPRHRGREGRHDERAHANRTDHDLPGPGLSEVGREPGPAVRRRGGPRHLVEEQRRRSRRVEDEAQRLAIREQHVDGGALPVPMDVDALAQVSRRVFALRVRDENAAWIVEPPVRRPQDVLPEDPRDPAVQLLHAVETRRDPPPVPASHPPHRKGPPHPRDQGLEHGFLRSPEKLGSATVGVVTPIGCFPAEAVMLFPRSCRGARNDRSSIWMRRAGHWRRRRFVREGPWGSTASTTSAWTSPRSGSSGAAGPCPWSPRRSISWCSCSSDRGGWSPSRRSWTPCGGRRPSPTTRSRASSRTCARHSATTPGIRGTSKPSPPAVTGGSSRSSAMNRLRSRETSGSPGHRGARSGWRPPLSSSPWWARASSHAAPSSPWPAGRR